MAQVHSRRVLPVTQSAASKQSS